MLSLCLFICGCNNSVNNDTCLNGNQCSDTEINDIEINDIELNNSKEYISQDSDSNEIPVEEIHIAEKEWEEVFAVSEWDLNGETIAEVSFFEEDMN